MQKWEKQENEGCEHLNQEFGEHATFIHLGGSDSTVSDIKVITASGKVAYIECKCSVAQFGQFVVEADVKNKSFNYGIGNKTKLNIFSQAFIDEMQKDFEKFYNAGTAGVVFEFEDVSKIAAKWIEQKCIEKNVIAILIDKTIIPIKNLEDYFEIKATYRQKKSGSSDVGKNNISSVIKFLSEQDYDITSFQENGKKLFITSSKNLDKQKFYIDDNEYMFAYRNGEYEIRKLSKTKNSNVIFSIKLKEKIEGLSPEEFVKILKDL